MDFLLGTTQHGLNFGKDSGFWGVECAVESVAKHEVGFTAEKFWIYGMVKGISDKVKPLIFIIM